MKRAVVVALVVLPPLVGLFALERRRERLDAPIEPLDEILAYEVSPQRSVTIRVPGALDEVLVTTWAVVASHAAYDPAVHYPYAYTITFVDRDGHDVGTRRFELSARVILPSATGEDFSARLAGSDAWVTDSRTAQVTVPPDMRGGGSARIAWASGDVGSFLVRTAYAEARSLAEQRVVEQALSRDQRKKLDEGRTALGFLDLAPESRRRALAKWGRRLDANGRQGVDFVVRRLLIGGLDAPERRARGVLPGLLVSARHAAALNFRGPVHLEISQPESGSVAVVDESGSRLGVVSAGDREPLHVADLRAGAHTLVVEASSDRDVRVHAWVPYAERGAQIGDVRRVDTGTKIELGADVRYVRAARLDGGRPIVVRVAPGQRHLKISVRGEIADAAADAEITGDVELRWTDPADSSAHATRFSPRLRRSRFDRWRNPASDATDAATSTLRLPTGVDHVDVVGDPRLLATFLVEDTLVTEDVLSPAYAVPLAAHETWKNAPYDIRMWLPIHPTNAGELERERRVVDLAAQVRIHSRGGGGSGAALPEATLAPDGEPVARHFLEPAELQRGEAFPRDAWTPLRGRRKLVVASSGPDAGRLRVSWVAEPSRLGGEIHVLVDGARVASKTLAVRSGSLDVRVAPGVHDVEIDGAGNDGLAFASCAPVGGGTIARRRIVHEVPGGGEIVYRFDQPRDEAVTLIVQVVTELRDVPYTVHYRIDNPGGERVGAMFTTRTVPSGALFGSTGEAGAGLLWEAARAAATTPRSPDVWDHGHTKAKIRIGDDRAGTSRKLTLRLARPDEGAWVRVVVVGSGAAARTESTLWLAEDEDTP